MEKMSLIVAMFYVIATVFVDSSAIASESIDKEVKLFNFLKNVKTNESSLSQDKLDEIARKMTINYKTIDNPFLKKTLIEFYSLNKNDIEEVLIKIRDISSNLKTENDSRYEYSLDVDEYLIQNQVRELNETSMEKYGIPFHAAAIRGRDISPENNKLFDFQYTPESFGDTESFPRYIGTAAPWRLKLGTKWSTVRRYEDGVFGYKQCGFPSIIRNWISYTPAVIAMIYSNGYGGGRLAANSNCFFHKWWTLPAFGYTPIHISSLLWARVY